MKNTVVVLNEELGSMSFAFERAGFNVVASYEDDIKACGIYKCNLADNLITENIFKTDIYSIPDADVIVGKLVYPFFRISGQAKNIEQQKFCLKEIKQLLRQENFRSFYSIYPRMDIIFIGKSMIFVK